MCSFSVLPVSLTSPHHQAGCWGPTWACPDLPFITIHLDWDRGFRLRQNHCLHPHWLNKINEWVLKPNRKWEVKHFLHISKQECYSHWWFQSSTMSWWALRKIRMWKHRIVAPDSWEIKGTVSVSPDSCIFPHIWKVLNYLTWDI